MKYIVYASCIHVDVLSQKGVDKFIDEVTDFYCMIVENNDGYVKEEDFLISLKKMERYGSFIFVSHRKYKQLLPHSDDE